MKTYGKVLGRLAIVRRGKPRPGSRSGDCKHCKKPVVQGEAHFVLLRTIGKKKAGRNIWTTRRFHQTCFLMWLIPAESWLEENEKKANANRTGRPKVNLNHLSDVEVEKRSAMMKRRSHLWNRLFRNPDYDAITVADINHEIEELQTKIMALAPSANFVTKKRKERYLQYQEQIKN